MMKLKAMGVAFAADRATRIVCAKAFVRFLQAPFGFELAHFLALIANDEPTSFYRWLKRACRDRSSAGWAAAENHRPTADNGLTQFFAERAAVRLAERTIVRPIAAFTISICL